MIGTTCVILSGGKLFAERRAVRSRRIPISSRDPALWPPEFQASNACGTDRGPSTTLLLRDAKQSLRSGWQYCEGDDDFAKLMTMSRNLGYALD